MLIINQNAQNKNTSTVLKISKRVFYFKYYNTKKLSNTKDFNKMVNMQRGGCMLNYYRKTEKAENIIKSRISN